MLIESLEIKAGQVISLVGGGGKTTTMFRLARELVNLNHVNIITTTTTRILEPSSQESDQLLLADNLDDLLSNLDFTKQQVVTLAKQIQDQNKLVGIPKQWVNELKKELNSQGLNIIVEADGAACKDFKFPNAKEPVLPSSTDLLLPIVGNRIANCQLTAKNLHRAPLLVDNSEFVTGQPITPQLVVDILLSKSGYDLLSQQQQRRVIPILNQVDVESSYTWAKEVALKLVEAGIKKVLLTSMQSQNLVREVVER
ncbi:selenium cofactor biosynthesis protein YqeC [Fuchsiella alkaliacetigena]|uniref:selenium cofactor biosynthesis protein YqeC n=1 Tax=Fuchsiella alkaliacetigena TaxID=957042 RepID=UPI00200B0822|nr:selenium cofactor biosynthesis protein YqeC [Fuchsiella alkaliacetigena]